MKFVIKLVFALKLICVVLGMEGLTGIEIYKFLTDSENKKKEKVNKICDSKICSFSTAFFRNELFKLDDHKLVFSRDKIVNQKLFSFQKTIRDLKEEIRIKEYKQDVSKLEEKIKLMQVSYDKNKDMHLKNKLKLYDNIRKLKNDNNAINMGNKIKIMLDSYDNYDNDRKNLYEKIKELIDEKNQKEKTLNEYQQKVYSDEPLEKLNIKFQKFSQIYYDEEIAINRQYTKNVCNKDVVEYFNKGYMIYFTIKKDHHFVIIKESKESDVVSIFQAFVDFYTLQEWMDHYFLNKVNIIKNISSFCDLLNNVISSNKDSIAFLFSNAKSKDVGVVDYFLKGSGRIILDKVEVWKPVAFILRRRKRKLFLKNK